MCGCSDSALFQPQECCMMLAPIQTNTLTSLSGKKTKTNTNFVFDKNLSGIHSAYCTKRGLVWEKNIRAVTHSGDSLLQL